MSFGERLTALRKARGLNQRAFAELAGVHLSQIRRYESDSAQPALDIIRRLAVVLSVSADTLVFADDERGPQEDRLRLIFEAVERCTPEEQATVREVLEALVLRYQARQWDTGR